ncbi:hypothetical protein BKN38_09135 [Helicobacter sp. CLO-3]|uniref:hemerythrin family protein n=1 Tax=unclassified Helicobacter TaxID=2593540 RepID=UPI0008059881|nr:MULTISPECIES: hemerythrin family protein [unclassified Helicobacter]OBV28734.1 hypothetical protein BA723_08225 [Helicobacter sp. CLO-3]OHU81386.1 hypothetical protein BKN38_09135 [Helicobacter sp. CLO-3]
MAIPEWSSKFSINNEIIDEQHKKLFDIANKAQSLINRQVSSDEIRAILAELFEYMKVHFRDEEAYMASIGYPDLDKQHEMHKQIIKDMTALIQDIRYDFKQKLATITEEWLVNHILKEDALIEKWRAAHKEEIKANQAKQSGEEIIHIYKCDCKPAFKVLDTVHKKIQAGQVFHCKKCGSVIEFVRDE